MIELQEHVGEDGVRNRGGDASFTDIRLGSTEGDALTYHEGIDTSETKQGLNVWRLAALTFFTVSGGPYGLEPLIATVGPLYSIIGILAVPWVWGLPSAFMTAELASALPEMGGYIVWVQRSMGDFWAFQNAMWNIFCNSLDNSLYPVLFTDYIEQMIDHEFSYFTRAAIGVSMVVLLALVNVIGVDVVGDGAGVFGIFVLLPFIVLVVVGFLSPKLDPSDWGKTIENPDWGLYVSILLWNTCGYDSAGTCAAEVENPGKIYPQAMLLTVVVTTLLYVGPIMVGVCFGTDYELWDDGYFVVIGELVGGYWLKLFVLVAGCVSALGLLNSTMCTSSRALACMASFGYVPSRLSRIHPTYGTPISAIFVNASAIIIMVLSGLDFESIAQLSMWLYALTLLFEFGALVVLRITEPDLERPYRIPGGKCGVYLLSIPPCLCCFTLMALSSPMTWVICLGILVFSLVMLVPYYMFSGKPVVLPTPLAFIFRLFRINNFFRPLQKRGARVRDEDGVTCDADAVELPDTITKNEPAVEIDWDSISTDANTDSEDLSPVRTGQVGFH